MAMRPATPPQLRVHDARELAGDAPEAILRLDGMDYRLRITRSGKLILTK
ncbi:hemin uptake protein HemP [Mesobaculum littorinae]|uniref:Hemin uptake protein HemP n=1 Tax=Mesobaculum littorinae TaxID=2486419 RepID=A0A438AG43_9RHOB|nr:hemin uptake protein HemP [Mesobaculum littorinae]RVV97664.1 hemin uptake protein HemP [Mesobaculum littorinae]